MKKIILKGKEIEIREMDLKDLKRANLFLDYINSLVEEGVKIYITKKKTIKEEREYLKNKLKQIKNKKEISLIAECDNIIIGMTEVSLLEEAKDHIGVFSIAVAKNYRKIGLGKYLAREVIKIAKEELKSLKFIQLSAFSDNKPAINLYNKMGFKIVAKIPKSLQYKGRLLEEVIMMKKIKR